VQRGEPVLGENAAACERAVDTWVVDVRGRNGYSHTIVVAHPGQLANDPEMLDPERLLYEFGVTPDQKVIRLSESEQAPARWSPEVELEHARREVALLRSEQAVRARIEREVMARAEQQLAELEAELEDAVTAEAS